MKIKWIWVEKNTENIVSKTCATLCARHVRYVLYVRYIPVYFRANSEGIAQHTHSHTECLGLSWLSFWDGGRMSLSVDVSVGEREVSASVRVRVSGDVGVVGEGV